MTQDLREQGEVREEGVTIRARGMEGQVRVLVPGGGGVRAETISVGDVDRALEQEDVTTSRVVEITEARVYRTPTPADRGPSGAAQLEFDVPAPAEGYEQMILSRDETGVHRWHFADEKNRAVSRIRGSETRTYRIPVTGAGGAPAPTASRGGLGAIGKKLFKVLVFPVAKKVAGWGGKWLAHEFEQRKRKYAVRMMTPANYRQPAEDPTAFSPDWEKVSSGRALLLLHGTNMLSHLEFGRIAEDRFASLCDRYGGRVVALDHPTLSEDPKQNVEYLLSQIPIGTRLDLDLLTVSRGGLVGRYLAERQVDLDLQGRTIGIDTIVFVAVPNSGTILADAKHWETFIDRYTNMLTLIPDNPVTDVLDSVVTIAKVIAVGVLDGLPGLKAMSPGGAFLSTLNVGNRDDKRYFAVAANYEPQGDGLRAWTRDMLIDAVFEGQGNDLIVPTEGVYSDEVNPSKFFPIADPLLFGIDQEVDHSGYLKRADTMDALDRWLHGL